MKYPHLTDATAFPNVNGATPYAQYRNDFDYNRWEPGTKLTVCNVPWDDARNIVAWEDEAARDAWFANREGEHETLTTEFHKLPDGTIKLPIPFATLSRYNYLWVEYPLPTSPTDPLDHAKTPRVTHWGFFIESPRQLAASTTECVLRLDNWTTFGPYVHINYCQLKRGHAPLAATNAVEYLKNPIENAGLLLAPDVTYGDAAGITRDHTFIPMGAGEKYVMFSSLMAPDDLTAMGEAVAWDGASTGPTYADTADRWGHQWDVKGYEWHIGAKDYGKTATPVKPITTSPAAPTGGTAYAVKATDAAGLFENIVDKTPQFMQTIQGMWVVPAEFINITDAPTHTIAGVTVYEAQPVNDMPDIKVNLTEDMFGYPDEYKGLAKLYTFPYACLTLSDNDGTSVDVRIENTGDLTVHRRVMLAYPYLKAQAFLTGVNGTGAKTYEWRDLTGASHDEKSWDTDFADFMASFDIPTYGLYMDGYTDFALRNQQGNIDAARLKALNAYKTGQRSNNTGYENTLASNNTGNTNAIASADTGLDNANRAADTGYTNTETAANTALDNANRSADTTYTNTIAGADTAYGNGKRVTDAAKANADRSANTALTNGNASAATALTNTRAANATMVSNTNRSADTAVTNQNNTNDNNTANVTAQNDFATYQTNTTNSQALTSVGYNNDFATNQKDNSNSLSTLQVNQKNEESWVNATGSIVKSVAGAVKGGPGAAVSAGLDIAATVASTYVAASNATEYNEASKAANDDNTQQSNDVNTNSANLSKFVSEALTGQSNALSSGINDRNNQLAVTNTKNSTDTDRANANATAGTSNANAERTNATTVANNKRNNATALTNNALNWEVQLGGTDDTDGGNLGRNKSTAYANAQRLRDVTKQNAQASRNMTVDNAVRSRDTSKGNAQASRNTGVDNANRSRDTGNANALESRESTEYTLKTMLEQEQTVTALTYANNRNNAPVSYGSFGGDPTPDLFRYRGVQVRVKTQTEAAIRQTGDQFLRYGYAYEGNWNVKTLAVMPKFSYWECAEVWLDSDTDIMEEAKNAIRTMLEGGVTAWTNPDEIGKVGLYENQ